MCNWLYERFKMWKWVVVLGALVLFIPMWTAPLIAQNGRGGEAALRTGCPLLCCSDVRGPDIGPGGALIILGIFAVIIVALVIISSIEEANKKKQIEKTQQEEAARQAEQQKKDEESRLAREKKLAEDALKYPQLVGKKVHFYINQGMNGTTSHNGVVMSQDEDRLTINYLSDGGHLLTATKTIPEVTTIS